MKNCALWLTANRNEQLRNYLADDVPTEILWSGDVHCEEDDEMLLITFAGFTVV